MPTLLLEFWLMTISTHLASWSAGINRVFADCCASLPATISPLPTISPRKRSFGHTGTFGVFAVKLDSRRGYIGSPIIASGKMPAVRRNLLGSMNRNGKGKLIRKPSNQD